MNKKYSRKNVFSTDGNLLSLEERTFITNEGYTCTLIDGGTCNSFVTVQIENYTFEVRTGDVKRGEVAYPLHKTILSTGYVGIGEYSNKTHKTAYAIWRDMLRRSYDIMYHERQPTYKDVTVHHDWHNFQNFADWFYTKSNYQDGWHLDKDLLSVTAKIYSQDTCVFVPQALNNFMVNVQLSNTSGYTGVSWCKQSNSWIARIKLVNTKKYKSLGYFSTKEEAAKAYDAARAEQAQVWKDRMQGILPQHILNTIK